MSFIWDSNILRHYLDDHPLLLENLKKVPRGDVMLPVVVVAEQFRGRMDAILKAQPAQLPRAQQFFQQTQGVMNKFQLLYFNDQSLTVVAQLIAQFKTRKRYADVLIAAQAIAGHHILVTRNTADFRDLLPPQQLQNWIDEKIS
ncbi:MAG: type II toxin-antitoxin system VapC family toxin [Blastocatellia bacterium]